MPAVPFDSLPDSARVWVFAADRPLAGAERDRLLSEVDRHLAGWAAHGAPLTAARQWGDDHFLTIAVDQRTANASGCSIDGLFRTLQRLEPELDARLVGGGRVLYRDAAGAVRSADRGDFMDLVERGEVGRDTRVFDQTVPTLGDWRQRFETTAAESWHAALL